MSYYAITHVEQFNPTEFVHQWSQLYQYEKEKLYVDNIIRPLEPKKIVRLYWWKNGGKFSGKKKQAVRKFIKGLRVLNEANFNPTPCEFLNRHFHEGGAIWRIFFLHCWKPDKYSIFDQHVYRAMQFIQTGQLVEIPDNNDEQKIGIYLTQYLKFIQDAFENYNPKNTSLAERLKQIDKALVTFGRFLKSFNVS